MKWFLNRMKILATVVFLNGTKPHSRNLNQRDFQEVFQIIYDRLNIDNFTSS